MESFGAVRMVDIPSCDELRKEMNSQISGIKSKGFSFGQVSNLKLHPDLSVIFLLKLLMKAVYRTCSLPL